MQMDSHVWKGDRSMGSRRKGSGRRKVPVTGGRQPRRAAEDVAGRIEGYPADHIPEAPEPITITS